MTCIALIALRERIVGSWENEDYDGKQTPHSYPPFVIYDYVRRRAGGVVHF